ncbi:hypothetical protein K1719_019582 [Acacia pycnantha]|nr:hypothetical protein K1719_019582 [Acacia pycnantha]
MEGASNGGMCYHEVQESKLCAMHCVNTVLQGPFFSEFDMAALASDLDLDFFLGYFLCKGVAYTGSS